MRNVLISRLKLSLCGAALLALIGCMGAENAQPKDKMPSRQVTLLDGTVVVRTPEGYCIDDTSTRNHTKAGFVLMAGCDGLMGLPSGTLVTPAILTVAAAVGPGGEDTDITPVTKTGEVLERHQMAGLNMVRVSDENRVPEGSDPRHWRGVMTVNGAVLALAVYGNSDVAGKQGKLLLQSLAKATQAASAGIPASRN